jgi:hypothetical protein
VSELIQALEERKSNNSKTPSMFQKLLESLPEEERKAVERSLDLIRSDNRKGRAKVYSCAWLADVLTSHGYPVSRTTIRRYLNENTDNRH